MPDHPTIHSTHRLDLILLLLLFVGGIILRLALIAPTGFDGLYGQDPYAYYDFAAELRSAIADGHSLPPFFWPLGYPALVGISGAIFGTAPQVGQLLNIILGVALAPLVYLLVRQMGGGRWAALTAGLLMAVCGQAVQSSLVIMADIPALFWGTVSAVLLWRYINHFQTGQPDKLSLPLASLTLALAIITRWLYLVLIIPWGLTLLITWHGRIHWRDVAFPHSGRSDSLYPTVGLQPHQPLPCPQSRLGGGMVARQCPPSNVR